MEERWWLKFGGRRTIVCGCFSTNGPGNISVLDGRMNASVYKANLMISVENLELSPGWIFQQDNNPKHTAKSTKKWFAENNLDILK